MLVIAVLRKVFFFFFISTTGKRAFQIGTDHLCTSFLTMTAQGITWNRTLLRTRESSSKSSENVVS